VAEAERRTDTKALQPRICIGSFLRSFRIRLCQEWGVIANGAMHWSDFFHILFTVRKIIETETNNQERLVFAHRRMRFSRAPGHSRPRTVFDFDSG